MVLAETAQTTEPALRIQGLRKAFGGRRVLDDVSLTVAPGELVAILGANGSGKSTVLRCVVGLVEPDGGEIDVAGRHAAMIFQQIHLVRRRNAIDNVCAGALGRLSLRESLTPALYPRALREEAMQCLARVGLDDRAAERVSRLSGGQQQRVAIARGLCQRAQVILADEPVAALDPAAAEQVMGVLSGLARAEGLAVAAVLHQPELARRHADRLVGLKDGRVVFDAATADVTDSEIEGLY